MLIIGGGGGYFPIIFQCYDIIIGGGGYFPIHFPIIFQCYRGVEVKQGLKLLVLQELSVN